jgi:hypothetical protein
MRRGARRRSRDRASRAPTPPRRSAERRASRRCRRCRDARAGGERHLQGGEADRASAAVDQNPLASLHARQLFQCVEGGEEGDRHGGSGIRVEAGRQGRERLGPRQGVGGEGGRRHAEDAIASAERGAFAGFLHHAGALHAEAGACEAVQQRFFGQQVLRPHHVAEVDARGFDAQQHFARAWCQRFQRLPVQGVELAWIPNHEPGWARRASPRRRQVRPETRYAASGHR